MTVFRSSKASREPSIEAVALTALGARVDQADALIGECLKSNCSNRKLVDVLLDIRNLLRRPT